MIILFVVVAFLSIGVPLYAGADISRSEYEAWKTEQENAYTNLGYETLDKIDHLIEVVNKFREYLANDPANSWYANVVIFAYNFLREILNKPAITKPTEVDQSWLDSIEEENISFRARK